MKAEIEFAKWKHGHWIHPKRRQSNVYMNSIYDLMKVDHGNHDIRLQIKITKCTMVARFYWIFRFKNDPRKKQQSELFFRNLRRKWLLQIIHSLPLFSFWLYFQLFRRLLLVLHWRAILLWQKYWWVEKWRRQSMDDGTW